jgi:hypothetical protein
VDGGEQFEPVNFINCPLNEDAKRKKLYNTGAPRVQVKPVEVKPAPGEKQVRPGQQQIREYYQLKREHERQRQIAQ